MQAADVMVTDVIVVRPEDTVRDVASQLVDSGISAAPVVTDDERLVGIVSEGDLIRRAEIGTEHRRSWWLELLTSPEARARDFVKAHAVKVADVMTKDVITATEDMPLREVATLLERNGIKRVPIVRGNKLVGLVSRRNIIQAFAETAATPVEVTANDKAIHDAILDQVRALPWGKPWLLTVTINDGAVKLWGAVDSDQQRQAIRVAAEATPGVTRVEDHLFRIPASIAA